MTKAAPSRKNAVREIASPRAAVGAADGAIIAALLALALFMMGRAGFRRGMELMPWPDGLEYAATAVDLDHGLGPVLHFGGYSYPSRYAEGYPLILAAAYPILGHRVQSLCLVSVAMGLTSVVALYLLTLLMFGRASASAAALLLTLSPMFITYSTLVLSDVPTLAVTIMVAILLYRASEAEESSAAAWIILSAMCGLLAGFTVIIRPTNATILVGIAVAMAAAAPRRETREIIRAAAAFGTGFAVFPIWQAIQNYRYLGGPFRNGYAFWVPEVYGSFAKTFGARFLFGPTMPRNPHGNVISYLVTLAGVDGLLGDPGNPRYTLYPFAAAVFAVIGIVTALRSAAGKPMRRVIWFGIAFLGALVLVYLFYFFTEIAFILPALFVIFSAAGYGVVVANRAMRAANQRTRKRSRDLAITGIVALLDLMLTFSVLNETAARAAASPQPSHMVPALISIRQRLEPDAIVISNISLQFLELYVAKAQTRFVGLNSFDPGGNFTDYHLNRLYTKRSAGWNGPVPPVVFPGQRIDDEEAKSLSATARAGKPVYLLLNGPERPDYADLLKDELGQLSAVFSVEEIAQSDLVDLFRLKAR